MIIGKQPETELAKELLQTLKDLQLDLEKIAAKRGTGGAAGNSNRAGKIEFSFNNGSKNAFDDMDFIMVLGLDGLLMRACLHGEVSPSKLSLAICELFKNSFGGLSPLTEAITLNIAEGG